MSEIQTFIRQARERGIDAATIHTLLRSAGWKETEIARELAAEVVALPIPRPRGVSGAGEVFRNILEFGLLTFTLAHLVMLYFGCLDRSFPDPANPQFWNLDSEEGLSGHRFSLAAVMVTFPLYLAVAWLAVRQEGSRPPTAATPVRRGFQWLTLLVSGLTILGNLIALLFWYFEGQLHWLTLLKIGVLLTLALSVFSYQALLLRREGGAAA
jgi:hypothetical protein